METYRITIETDQPEYGGEVKENWSGYGEQGAIAQAFLYHTQNGARALKVKEIELVIPF